MKKFKKNCCDGIYNSFDVHFTSVCDNKCAHCIDKKYTGAGSVKPNIYAIFGTILEHQEGFDDVLFLGGEPCFFLEDLVKCVELVRLNTNLKIYVTTAVPAVCVFQRPLFERLLELVDGINLSVQHHDEKVADEIRRTESIHDRQRFYREIPHKEKVRINLNIVKPFLYTKEDITACLKHYDEMGFNEIKLSEIQHGKEYFVSFEETFGIKLPSPFYGGCQTRLNMEEIVPGIKTPVLLKRSCFMCEETLKASPMDGVKVLHKLLRPATNKYGVVYGNGQLSKGWI